MKKITLVILAFVMIGVTLIVRSPNLIQAKENPSVVMPSPEKKAGAQELPKPDLFDKAIFNWSRSFAEVIHLTKEKHYRVDDPEKCMIQAINGFLNCLDPHSSYMDPKTYKMVLEMTSGEFFGIGIVIDATRKSKDRFMTVVELIPDGSADKAGVKQYDKIIEIDGKLIEGMTTEEATAMLRGPKGTTVAIKVMRGEKPEPISFDIARDVVKERSSLCFYIPDYHVYYVSLTTFSQNSQKQIKELLEKATKNPYKGLILDLRNNSGGLLTTAVEIAGLFVDKGSLVVTTKDKNDAVTASYSTSTEPIANSGLPIMILINNYTASAAEILAGVLKIQSELAAKNASQKKLMVFLVGTKTFGKGSVQEVIPVGNDCAVKLTTSLYYLPNDTSIQGQGIEPDFVIERGYPAPEQLVWFQKFYGREGALKGSLKPNGVTVDEKDKNKDKSDESSSEEESGVLEVKEQKTDAESKKTWGQRVQDALSKDNQFLSCLTLINIFDNARATAPAEVENRNKAIDYLKKNFVAEGVVKIEEVKSES